MSSISLDISIMHSMAQWFIKKMGNRLLLAALLRDWTNQGARNIFSRNIIHGMLTIHAYPVNEIGASVNECKRPIN